MPHCRLSSALLLLAPSIGACLPCLLILGLLVPRW